MRTAAHRQTRAVLKDTGRRTRSKQPAQNRTDGQTDASGGPTVPRTRTVGRRTRARSGVAACASQPCGWWLGEDTSGETPPPDPPLPRGSARSCSLFLTAPSPSGPTDARGGADGRARSQPPRRPRPALPLRICVPPRPAPPRTALLPRPGGPGARLAASPSSASPNLASAPTPAL